MIHFKMKTKASEVPSQCRGNETKLVGASTPLSLEWSKGKPSCPFPKTFWIVCFYSRAVNW